VEQHANAFVQLFECSLDGVLLMRADGTIVRANSSACRSLGRSEEDICRVGRQGIVVDDAAWTSLVDGHAVMSSVSGELVCRREDGTVFPVEFSYGPIPGNGLPLAYVIFRDITQRHHLEDLHRRTERALRLLTRCNQALARASSEEALFLAVCQAVVESGGYRMCWVGLALEDERKSVQPVVHAGHEDGYLATADIVWADTPRGHGPTGTCIRTGRPVVGGDFEVELSALRPWRAHALARGYRTSIGLPLMHEGQRFGAITMYSAVLEKFDQEEMAILEQLSRDVSFGVHSLRERAARVRVEGALHKSQAMLKSITDTIPELIFVKDLEGRYTFANPATLHVMGKQEQDVLGQTDTGIYSDARTGQMLVDIDRRIMDSGVSAVVEEIVDGPTGHRVWLATKTPLRDAQGRVMGLVGSALDITDRKRTEDALRASESRLQFAMEGANDGIWDVDLEKGSVFLSPRGCEMLGYSPLEFNADIISWNQMVHPDDLPATQAALGRCLSGEAPLFQVEQRLRHRAGHYLWTLARGKVSQRDADGNAVRLTGTHTDITQRKHTDADRERLTTAIEQAAEMVLVTDTQGTIVYVNPAFEAVTGYTRAEMVGHTPRMLKSNAQDKAFYRELWETISSGRTWRGRVINRKKDGTHFTEESTISPVRDADGVITSYVSVKRDITRDLALEAQLLQSQKMEGIGSLAGGVAHDFNNIVSVILGCAGFALTTLKEGDAVREDLLEIAEAGRRAAALTRQLLAFSRKQLLQPVPMDLNRILSEMDKMLRRIIGEDVELILDLAADLGIVTADPGQVEQVVMNLAVNARDAMPNGGTLTLQTRNVELGVADDTVRQGLAAGPCVMMSVRDSGVGMDARTLERIFEPFFTTKEMGKGTGLGLSTVYGIVKQSGGHILVTSQPGRGSTFTLYLPRRKTQLEALAVPVPANHPRARAAETILVVEDDAALRSLARRCLQDAGYQVLTAANGPEALDTLGARLPEVSLILTDVIMPQMSGPALVARLTAEHVQLKVLFMSGYTDNAMLRHGMNEPGIQFIGKPFTHGALLEKVRQVLDGPPRPP
jgi:PAS domain S-box-containing protein